MTHIYQPEKPVTHTPSTIVYTRKKLRLRPDLVEAQPGPERDQ